TILVTILVVRFIPIFNEYFSHISTFEIIFISLLTSIVAIIGDLLESVLKRASSVKDSGNLIPGRGGVLDSIDSILLAAPIYYLLIKIF
ncbi:MAG: phosphatidate cytidylyltransferase, partial [Treponema sp.]|nr:phosphatidate cytidylyltransferase [Treponema sp.]